MSYDATRLRAQHKTREKQRSARLLHTMLERSARAVTRITIAEGQPALLKVQVARVNSEMALLEINALIGAPPRPRPFTLRVPIDQLRAASDG